MSKRILVAGATGAVGKRLLPLLVAEGCSVSGTTRSPDRMKIIEGTGAHAIVVDVFDSAALARAVQDARPQIIIHQLTDLPPGLDPARMAQAVPRNARIRGEGTRNLVTAALAAGASRLISQSIAWRSQGISAEGVQVLEHLRQPRSSRSTRANRESSASSTGIPICAWRAERNNASA